ncbi:MAG: thioredoxin domain-containing protein [Chloroflexi bacterium]|nr:thioredoxin domain-containing protein [Chloroflexota bacterium]
MNRKQAPTASRRDRREQARLERPIRPRPRVTARPGPRPLWQSPMVLVTVIAILATAVVIAVNLKPRPGPTGFGLRVPPASYAADLVSGDALGKANAPVRLEIWSDFQCPVCARLAVEQLPTLETRFVDTGLLRIEARDIAILGTGTPDESLELATGAVCAARQNRYWPFHDLVFWNQGRENRGDHNAAFIESVADKAGLDRTAWDACVAAADARGSVKTETISALGIGIRGTPTISLNGGTPVAGLPDANALIAQIQALVDAAASASPAPATSAPAASATTAPSASATTTPSVAP